MARNDAKTFLTLSFAAALVVVSACRRNHAPDVPAVLAGPDTCFTDTTYAFVTTATDLDGDSVQVRFDWGDSTLSDWGVWLPSGDSIALTHAWSDTGPHKVTAQARDQKLLTSNWSNGLAIRVVHHRPYHAPNTPAEPSGPVVGGQDSAYFFTTTVTHPDSIPVAVRFAWSNGDTSAWSAFVSSGESISMSHAWHDTGSNAVRAQAKDTSAALSSWSEPHSITVRPLDVLRKWRFHVSNPSDIPVVSSPAIAPDGTIYVVSPDSALYAINPDGTLKWRRPTTVNVRSSPAIAADGTVYVGCLQGYLSAINPDSTLKWSRQFGPPSPVSSPSVAADGHVYCFDWNGIYVVDAAGRASGSVGVSTTTDAAVAIEANSTFYGATRDGVVRAWYQDRRAKWLYPSYAVNPTDLAIAGDGTIYFGSERSQSSSFAALFHSGALRWNYDAGGDVRSAPAIAPDGTVYFGSTDNHLYALNPDGSLKWRNQTDGDVDAGPAVAVDGTVYVGSDDSCLYAVNADGTLRWRYKTGGSVESAPTIGTDGTVYFLSADGYLYALNGTSPQANSPWPKLHHDLRNTSLTADSFWTRMDTVGDPILAPDSSGFTVHVTNVGNACAGIGSLFSAWMGGDSAYMRDFLVDGAHGYGYPVPNGQPGTGYGDTIEFAPVAVAPNRTQQVEFQFLDFHVDSLGADPKTNVAGKQFQFRFADGSQITVLPH